MTAALKSADELETRLTDWLARCALGDRQAFRQLYEATSPRLLGVLAQLVGRGALAEDLLQDVYVRIWKAAGQYRAGAGSPMAWMAATARYRAIDHLRSRGARPEVAIADLSVKMIADQAGVSPATVYNLFGTKAAVMEKVYDRDLADFQQRMSKAPYVMCVAGTVNLSQAGPCP